MDDYKYATDGEIVGAVETLQPATLRQIAEACAVPWHALAKRLPRLVASGRLGRTRNGSPAYLYMIGTSMVPVGDSPPLAVPASPSDVARLIEIADASWQNEMMDIERVTNAQWDAVGERLRRALAGYQPRNIDPELPLMSVDS